ncbi:hypothetical protein EZS27_007716 [termite gut metagenome]|uniref:GLUG domain-containing protein n=1 Tax=termite gut metagenome TaxID=433724 RepID=A0A5J4SHG1_9ZZZZ
MKKIISHVLIVLSFVAFMVVGCEKNELLSKESIALNVVELQLNTTRTNINTSNPTLVPPSMRSDWILEVQTEGNALTNYIWFESQFRWIPETTPILFTNVNSVYDIQFTLRPPISIGNEGQNGSPNGLLAVDTLEGILKNQSPKSTTPCIVLLSHLNSLIELTFDASVGNDITDITVKGSNVHLCRTNDNVYQFIAYRGQQQIILHIKYKGKDCPCTLDFPLGTQANRQYEIPISIVEDNNMKTEQFVSDVPRIAWWSEESINGSDGYYSMDNNNVDGISIFIEGYTDNIVINFLTKNQYELKPYSISDGSAIYHYPLVDREKLTIAGIQLKGLGIPPIPIGRTCEEVRDIISLKVGETGNLLFRTDANGVRLINTIAELQLLSESDSVDNFKASYKQESDIDFMSNPMTWTPIGWNESFPFSGDYNGNGHKIRNMYVSKSLPLSNNEISQGLKEEKMIGFFGYNTGVIRNLHLVSGELRVTINSMNINSKEQYDYSIGTICGFSNGMIFGCSNSDYLLYLHTEPIETRTVNFYVGGICGSSADNGGFYRCINNSKIEVIDNKGEGDLRVGGIVGLSCNKDQMVAHHILANHGELSVQTEMGIGGRTHGIGGLWGEVKAVDDNNISVFVGFAMIDGYNLGTITYIVGDQEYKYAVGGLVGIIEKYVSIWFQSSYNAGEMYISHYDKQTTSSNEEYLGCFLGKLEMPSRITPFISFSDSIYYNYTTIKKEGFILVNRPIGNFTEKYSSENEEFVNPILKAIYRFSEKDWPRWPIRMDGWGDIGGWNNGNPIYPTLWIETNQ